MSKLKKATFELVGDGRFQQCGEGRVELPVRVNGVEQVVYFSSPDCVLQPSDEALVSATLLPCMMTGYDYPRPLNLSRQFQEALPLIQDMYRAWLPQSRSIDIPCVTLPAGAPMEPGDKVGTFFSGGVDSYYTLLKHQDEITHLCFIHGADIPLENTGYRAEVASLIHKIGDRLGKGVIEVENNMRSFMDAFLPWPMAYGAQLRSIAMLLAGLRKCYIASSCSGAYLIPEGTHLVMDPLWSTSKVSFVHDGCEAVRFRKVEFISRYPITYDTLRVCWTHVSGEINCCQCEKCVRTMIHLQALERLDRFSAFSKPLDYSQYPVIRLKSGIADFYHPVLYYLRDTGEQPELLAYLEHLLFPPLRKRVYRQYRKWHKLIKRGIRDRVREVFHRRKAEKPAAGSRDNSA